MNTPYDKYMSALETLDELLWRRVCLTQQGEPDKATLLKLEVDLMMANIESRQRQKEYRQARDEAINRRTPDAEAFGSSL